VDSWDGQQNFLFIYSSLVVWHDASGDNYKQKYHKEWIKYLIFPACLRLKKMTCILKNKINFQLIFNKVFVLKNNKNLEIHVSYSYVVTGPYLIILSVKE